MSRLEPRARGFSIVALLRKLLTGRASRKPLQRPGSTRAPYIEQLEDRTLPAVTPTLLGDGTLDVLLDGLKDAASISHNGNHIRVSDGSTKTDFADTAVRGLN